MMLEPHLYRPLREWQTRLLRLHPESLGPDIRCDLVTVDLVVLEGVVIKGSAPEDDCLVQYDALSYTWGDHVPSQFRAISCNGCTVSVTPSLFSALSRLRYPYQPRNLWVDAICINQQNDEEKAVQIQHMLTIYMKARTVVGWLGPESSQTKAAVYALRSHGAEGMEVSMSFLELSSEIYGGLVDLYSRPWFRRLWVQQEVFAARRLEIRCGDILVEPRDLRTCPSEHFNFKHSADCNDPTGCCCGMDQRLSSLDTQYDTNLRVISHWLSPPESRHDADGRLWSRQPPPFLDTLFLASNLDAGDRRDYIYGILGMTNSPAIAGSIHDFPSHGFSRICIDYSLSVQDFCLYFTVYMLRKYQNLRVIFKYWEPPSGDAGGRWPSWSIDWTSLRNKEMPSEPELLCWADGFKHFLNDNRDILVNHTLVIRGRLRDDMKGQQGGLSIREGASSVLFPMSGICAADIVIELPMDLSLLVLRSQSESAYSIVGMLYYTDGRLYEGGGVTSRTSLPVGPHYGNSWVAVHDEDLERLDRRLRPAWNQAPSLVARKIHVYQCRGHGLGDSTHTPDLTATNLILYQLPHISSSISPEMSWKTNNAEEQIFHIV